MIRRSRSRRCARRCRCADGAPFELPSSTTTRRSEGARRRPGRRLRAREARRDGRRRPPDPHRDRSRSRSRPARSARSARSRSRASTATCTTAIQNRLHFAPGQTYSNARGHRDAARHLRHEPILDGAGPAGAGRRRGRRHARRGVGERSHIRSPSAAASASIRSATRSAARAGYQVIGWPMPLDTLTLDFRPAYAYLRDGSRLRAARSARSRGSSARICSSRTRSAPSRSATPISRTKRSPSTAPRRSSVTRFRSAPIALKLNVGYLIQRYDFRHPSALLDAMLQMDARTSITPSCSARTSKRSSSIFAIIRSSRAGASTPSSRSPRAAPYAGGQYTIRAGHAGAPRLRAARSGRVRGARPLRRDLR